MALKKYSFKIQSLKNLQDVNSPHVLVEFSFLANDEDSAKAYQNSLVEHYNENKPFQPLMPRNVTDLVSQDY